MPFWHHYSRNPDLSGAVADLGTFVPLAAALVLVNGLDPGAVLFAAGSLVLGAGAAFRVPFRSNHSRR